MAGSDLVMTLPPGVGQKTLHALRIMRDHGPLRPTQFAELMWPDSLAWQISYNCGPNGSMRGRGLIMSAGSYLGRMRKLGLTFHRYREVLGIWTGRWYITEEGRELLKEVAREDATTDAKPG